VSSRVIALSLFVVVCIGTVQDKNKVVVMGLYFWRSANPILLDAIMDCVLIHKVTLWSLSLF